MLNLPLYRALSKLYAVEVVDEDDKGDYVRTEEIGKNGRMWVNYRVQPGGRYGERYRMNCPFCSDNRKRYYVGYLFGHRDVVTQRVNYGNTHCFNEECQSEFSNLRDLMEDIEIAGFSEYFESSAMQPVAVEESTAPAMMGEVGRPGICIPLKQIAAGTDDYPAIEYLRDQRGFNIDRLADYYGVEYLKRSYTWKQLSGRIWTPFYRNGALIAWTARAVPSLCGSDIPHWHSKGGIGGLLYGLGGALQSRVLVVVEGPADKWKTGRPAVAVLGKKLGPSKRDRLISGLAGSSVELVLVMLDPEQPENEKHREHHIDETVAMLKRYTALPVFPVFLPIGKDPGSCTGEFLASYLQTALVCYGYPELGSVLARDVLSSTASR